jgi:membrane associated rhomboid family serine protease
MIPLHDDIPSRRRPIVTWLLILANILVFAYELVLGPGELEAFFRTWAVIPQDLSAAWRGLLAGNVAPWAFLPVLTAMFLHGGWLHIGSNMLYLWIFGDNIEDRMGHGGFLVFYLLAGAAATALQVGLNPQSGIPNLGASGAIAGVLGAYLVLYPDARVLTLVFLGFFLTTIRLSALWLLGIWFALQALQGAAEVATGRGDLGGVAWWAHVGGFVVGVIVGALLRRFTPKPRRNRFADRWYSDRW